MRRQLLEIDHDRIGRRRDPNELADAAHAFKAPGRILEIVVVQILDRLADADRLFDRPGRVRVEPQAGLGEGRAKRARHLDIMVWRKHAALQLVRSEAVTSGQILRMGDDFIGGRLTTLPRLGIRQPIEEIAREWHSFAHRAAEQVAGTNAKLLSGRVHAGHFKRRMDLQAVVIERGRRVHDLPTQLLKLERIMSLQIGQQPPHGRFRRFTAAAHLAEADNALVGDHLDDRADEPAPMGAACMPKRRFERHGDRGGADIDDFHVLVP